MSLITIETNQNRSVYVSPSGISALRLALYFSRFSKAFVYLRLPSHFHAIFLYFLIFFLEFLKFQIF